MSDWQLQDAKNRFSEVVKRARDEGPQTVTVHGRRAAVVLSAEAYDALVRPRKPLLGFMEEGPVWPDPLVDDINTRPKDTGRDVDL